MATLVLIHGVTAFAGFFAPYSYRRQFRDFPLAPPTPVRFVDAGGDWSLRPFVYPFTSAARPVPLRFLVRGERYRLLHLFETNVHVFGVEAPHQVFLLGTDDLGRDYFSRLLYGGRVSLMAGLIGTVAALVIALSLGAVAGYGGGWVDSAIMRGADLFLSLPWIYVLLAARAFLPLDLSPGAAFLTIVVLLGILGWAAPARMVRSVVAGAKKQEFVLAARSAGASHFRILRCHILPQTWGVLSAQASVLVPIYMIAEVTLSLVGLGVGEPMPSWGNMLRVLRRAGFEEATVSLFAPAFLMILVGWLYHMLGRPPRRSSSFETRLRWKLT